MKTIKLIALALILGSALFLAGQAQAFAIYNHTDQDVCLTKWYDLFNCHITVGKQSKYNGEHGAGLDGVSAGWSKGTYCYSSEKFDIPKGGFIRVYNTEIKIYDHENHHKNTLHLDKVDCKNTNKRLM